MKETGFQRTCREDWKFFFPSSHFVKIPDSIRSSEHRFIPFKPYDSYILLGDYAFAFEFKYRNDFRAIPLSHFHQDISLLEVSRNGGISFYVIGIESKKGEERYEEYYTEGKFRMVFFLNPLFPLTWKTGITKLKNEKSIRIEELFKFSDFVVGRKRKENESGIKWRFDQFIDRILKQKKISLS